MLISKFYLALLVIGITLVGMRFFNFAQQFRFIPDNGLEYAVIREMRLKECFPIVGPLLSVSNVYIPPTYFYYLYLITGYNFNPILTGYLSGTLKILTVVFLAGAVWLITNRAFFLASLAVLTSSWLLFDVSRMVWHPNPVNMWVGLSILLLTYAKLKRQWWAIVGACLAFWLANSIYPSPLLLLPWYLFELWRWPRPAKRNWWTHVLIGIFTLLVTAIPLYLPQIIFEAQNQWPTFQTFQNLTMSEIVTPAQEDQLTLSEWHSFLMTSILHLRANWPGYNLTVWFVTLAGVVFALASMLNGSHKWHFYFPYLPLVLLAGQFFFLNQLLPGQLQQHWLAPFFLILVPSFFEAAFRLWKIKPLRIIGVLLCVIIFMHNASYYWEALVAPVPNKDLLVYKTSRMENLKQFWQVRNIDPQTTLVLDHSRSEIDYTNTFALQYDAMENWTLLSYQTMIPPLSPACNEYYFFELDRIQSGAKNIFMLEPVDFAPAPQQLFTIFEKKFSFDLDQYVRVTWYVNSDLEQ